VHNKDSIFIYDDSAEFGPHDNLFLINVNGDIVDSYKIANLNEGDAAKMESQLVDYTQTMAYHKGFVYLLAMFSGYTNDENKVRLIRYNLSSREKSQHGVYNVKAGENYGIYTYINHFDYDFHNNRIYFSNPFEVQIDYFDIKTIAWKSINFNTEFFKKPKVFDGVNVIEYTEENTWFRDILVDTRDGTLMRKLQIPSNDFPIAFDVESEGSRIAMFRDVLVLIDPHTGNYSWVKDFNLHQVRFIHPEYGPMVTVQVDYDSLGINPQDYLFFAPVHFVEN
jgi:hypothetical protein